MGVIAHHIAASHYGTLDWVKLIVGGQPLPGLTGEDIHKFNAQHAHEHAACTRDEALALLRDSGAAIADYVAGLSDEDLDRTAFLALTDGDISTQGFIEGIIIGSGGEHFASLKATLGG